MAKNGKQPPDAAKPDAGPDAGVDKVIEVENLVMLKAAQRADAMLAKGDPEGLAVWKRILAAVEEVQRKERKLSESMH